MLRSGRLASTSLAGTDQQVHRTGSETMAAMRPQHQFEHVMEGGALLYLSDGDAKQDFTAIDPDDVLRQLAALPITAWRYRYEREDARHLGPTAQDFAETFHLGDTSRAIHSADANGVALAAIQALLRRVEAQHQTIESLKAELRELRGQG